MKMSSRRYLVGSILEVLRIFHCFGGHLKVTYVLGALGWVSSISPAFNFTFIKYWDMY